MPGPASASVSPRAPLFTPLSSKDWRRLRSSSASSLPRRLALLLRRQHSRVIDLFRALDLNLDGCVTRDELGGALERLGIRGITGDDLDALHAAFDRSSASARGGDGGGRGGGGGGGGGFCHRDLQLALFAHTPRRDEPKRDEPKRDADSGEGSASFTDGTSADGGTHGASERTRPRDAEVGRSSASEWPPSTRVAVRRKAMPASGEEKQWEGKEGEEEDDDDDGPIGTIGRTRSLPSIHTPLDGTGPSPLTPSPPPRMAVPIGPAGAGRSHVEGGARSTAVEWEDKDGAPAGYDYDAARPVSPLVYDAERDLTAHSPSAGGAREAEAAAEAAARAAAAAAARAAEAAAMAQEEERTRRLAVEAELERMRQRLSQSEAAEAGLRRQLETSELRLAAAEAEAGRAQAEGRASELARSELERRLAERGTPAASEEGRSSTSPARGSARESAREAQLEGEIHKLRRELLRMMLLRGLSDEEVERRLREDGQALEAQVEALSKVMYGEGVDGEGGKLKALLKRQARAVGAMSTIVGGLQREARLSREIGRPPAALRLTRSASS